jgi:hypothetical protein
LLQDIGCLACRLEGEHRGEDRRGTPADIHHLLNAGRRIGDHATIPLCPWHHRGVPPSGLPAASATAAAEAQLGPSYARNPAAFTARYGSQADLLALAEDLLKLLHRQGFT